MQTSVAQVHGPQIQILMFRKERNFRHIDRSWNVETGECRGMPGKDRDKGSGPLQGDRSPVGATPGWINGSKVTWYMPKAQTNAALLQSTKKTNIISYFWKVFTPADRCST